ncbi:M50 family metallopeptidase [Spongisporangium articulatum]|uniref:Zinc metalloprotease n=1 Tax=Spongisporangium articulatum TaxID=3362603 RepID=A0ABW8ARU8_9ACTN
MSDDPLLRPAEPTPQPPAHQQGEGVRVGRLLGVPVYLKPSWLLVALVITVLFAPLVRNSTGLAGGAYAVALTFAVLLLLSVLVHELAHAVVARLTGTPATHIVLDLWGGHTAFARDSSTPARAALVAAAGPVANLVLALAVRPFVAATERGDVSRLLLVATAYANLVVALFNALPGAPLDGGRVLEALVWRLTGDRLRAATVAGWAGRGVALTVAVVAVGGLLADRLRLPSAVWLLLIAGMLAQGAGAALAGVAWLRRAARADPGTLLRPAVSVPSGASVADALLAVARDQARAVVLLDVYGRPTAVVDERAAGQVPPAQAEQVRAAAVAEALVEGAVLDVRETGAAFIARLQSVPAPRYAVLDGAERVVGVLEWDDVARFVAEPT